jgi:hypothetical protein
LGENKIENIRFTDVLGVSDEYAPKPASSFIPDWYKNLDSYMSGEKKPIGDGSVSSTIKRCMPVFDSMTFGYILTTYVDLWVKQVPQVPKGTIIDQDTDMSIFPTQPFYEWANHEPLNFHLVDQAPTIPIKGAHELSYPKWMNPWSIATPPGYSSLFIQPLHRESVFTILPGVVDTDKYKTPVNFPFVLNQANTFEGLIPAGTPMAQVIPFKRDSWEMEVGSQKDFDEHINILRRVRSKFFDGYKTYYRQPKEYK